MFSRLPHHSILLISCPDQKGITASVTNFIFHNNGNIVHADQHIDAASNTFFMRVEWDLKGFKILKSKIAERFLPLAKKFAMHWEISFTEDKPRVALFVSKPLHCLQDLLIRYKAGQLNCQIPLIISNHQEAQSFSQDCGIRYYPFAITPRNKKEQEKRQLKILKEAKINLVILARYHQILTPQFVRAYPHKIINIHHSFLPAFAGKDPYRQAYEKGVKIIGATSHFVTVGLDEGPIIEQDTVRISHRDTLLDLIQEGQDLERRVLSRAVRWAIERKILCYGNKTVIFD